MTEIGEVCELLRKLRAPGGCDWDRAQTVHTLRPYLIEEAYEVLEELDRVDAGGPWSPLKEELGDLLFQIVFHCQLAEEQGQFGFPEVAEALYRKLVRRHPHLFADVPTPRRGWEELKAAERNPSASALDGVPRAAPSLFRSWRLGEKAAAVGFDWDKPEEVRTKVAEELAELDAAVAAGDRDAALQELGDVFLSLASYARKLDIAPEDAARAAADKFERRFRAMESAVRAGGRKVSDLTPAEAQQAWDSVKSEEKKRSAT